MYTARVLYLRFVLTSLVCPLATQTRRTVSSPASPALLHVRTLVARKVGQTGSEERGSVQWTGGAEMEVGAAAVVAPSYKGGGQGKTRPTSRRPTGCSLIPEKNVAEERPLSSFPLSFPHCFLTRFLTSCLPTITPWQWDTGGGKFFLEADLRI